MDPANEIRELQAELAELKQALEVPERYAGAWHDINVNIAAIRNQITALYGLRRPQQQQQEQQQQLLVSGRVNGPRTDLQRRVALMTARVECVAANGEVISWGSGCVIDANWTIVTAFHVVSGLADEAVDGAIDRPPTHCRAMLLDINGAPRRVNYNVLHRFDADGYDVATLVPAETLTEPCLNFFSRRVAAMHLDNVFTGARGPFAVDHVVFLLSDGWLNYTTPTQAFTTAFADKGWSGGPVFHFLDNDQPSLCGIVKSGIGSETKQQATQVQLLPASLLTEAVRDLRTSLFAQRAIKMADLSPMTSTSTSPDTSTASEVAGAEPTSAGIAFAGIAAGTRRSRST